jgi:hypothetical protein
MENHLRLHFSDKRRQTLKVSNIRSPIGCHAVRKSQLQEEEFMRLRIQCEAVNARAEGKQPFAKPGSLKSGVTGYKDTLSAVKGVKSH